MTKIVVDITKVRKKGLETRQALAAARRVKVKELRDQGLKVTEIAEMFDVTIDTIYRDLARIKREAESD